MNGKASIGLEKTCIMLFVGKLLLLSMPIQASLPSKHFIHKLNHNLKFGCLSIRHNKFVDVTKLAWSIEEILQEPKQLGT